LNQGKGEHSIVDSLSGMNLDGTAALSYSLKAVFDAGAVGTVLRPEFRDTYNPRLSDLSAIDNCHSNECLIQADLM